MMGWRSGGRSSGVSGPSGPSRGPCNYAQQRETTLTDGMVVPAGQRRFCGSDQAAALVSQKILSICAM